MTDTLVQLGTKCAYCGSRDHELADHKLLQRAGTAIEWAAFTFNAWWGCTKVPGSRACVYCYAEAWAKRTGNDVWGRHAGRKFFGDKRWNDPVKWNAEAERLGCRYRVFSASMSDVFEQHDDPEIAAEMDAARARLWALIEATPHLDWLLLTKRPQNIRSMVSAWWLLDWPANAWIGTTVEDQRWADERIPHLLNVPAAVRFLSCEPMVGPINLDPYLTTVEPCPTCNGSASIPVPGGGRACDACFEDPSGQGAHTTTNIHWVIAGGESGAGVKTLPMDPAWPRQLRDQCAEVDVAFLFKQWGDWAPYPQAYDELVGYDHPRFRQAQLAVERGKIDGILTDTDPARAMIRLAKKEAGRTLDGRTWDGVPTP